VIETTKLVGYQTTWLVELAVLYIGVLYIGTEAIQRSERNIEFDKVLNVFFCRRDLIGSFVTEWQLLYGGKVDWIESLVYLVC